MDDPRKESLAGEGAVESLLRSVDHPVPDLTASHVAAIVRSRRRSRTLRRAAVVVLALGAGAAAYALPGSPLPALLDRLTGDAAVTGSVGEPFTADADQGTEGIVLDAGDRLLVRTGMDAARIHVLLTDEEAIVLRTPQGAAAFSSSAGQVVVDARTEAAALEVRVPRDAVDLTVMAQDVVVFRVRDGRVTEAAPELHTAPR